MRYSIKSSALQVTADTLGAEMRSIRGSDGTEYLCPDSRRNWDGCAPVLFPNTGAVKDGYELIGGKRYPFSLHGFARDSQFSLIRHTDHEMTYELRWSEETLKRYPYRFVLQVSYRLDGNELTVKAAIRNEGPENMYASLGFHPGFSCPFSEGESAEDYEIVFPQPITATRVLLRNALVGGTAEKFWNGLSVLPVRNGMFDGGSFSMTDLTAHCAQLRSRKTGRSVTLYFEDYPYFVLWAPVGQPITNICMEPWHGIPDAADGDHQWETHPLTLQLRPGENKEKVFRIVCR